MSTVNVSGLARISCDTRWQPANEPADARYVGKAAGHIDASFGVSARDKEAEETLKSKRQKKGEEEEGEQEEKAKEVVDVPKVRIVSRPAVRDIVASLCRRGRIAC